MIGTDSQRIQCARCGLAVLVGLRPLALGQGDHADLTRQNVCAFTPVEAFILSSPVDGDPAPMVSIRSARRCSRWPPGRWWSASATTAAGHRGDLRLGVQIQVKLRATAPGAEDFIGHRLGVERLGTQPAALPGEFGLAEHPVQPVHIPNAAIATTTRDQQRQPGAAQFRMAQPGGLAAGFFSGAAGATAVSASGRGTRSTSVDPVCPA